MSASYVLQRGHKGARRATGWLNFDCAPDRQEARGMLLKARRLFPDYVWRITYPCATQDPQAQIFERQVTL